MTAPVQTTQQKPFFNPLQWLLPMMRPQDAQAHANEAAPAAHNVASGQSMTTQEVPAHTESHADVEQGAEHHDAASVVPHPVVTLTDKQEEASTAVESDKTDNTPALADLVTTPAYKEEAPHAALAPNEVEQSHPATSPVDASEDKDDAAPALVHEADKQEDATEVALVPEEAKEELVTAPEAVTEEHEAPVTSEESVPETAEKEEAPHLAIDGPQVGENGMWGLDHINLGFVQIDLVPSSQGEGIHTEGTMPFADIWKLASSVMNFQMAQNNPSAIGSELTEVPSTNAHVIPSSLLGQQPATSHAPSTSANTVM